MRILDLFCGAGGASMGYHQAWPDAEIVGVDNVPQPDYPFTFIQGDATDPPFDLTAGHFDFIHASPPCQSYSNMSNRWGSDAEELIGRSRFLIQCAGVPGVIENVTGAKASMENYIMLTGYQFGLATWRPRLFELIGFWALAPATVRGVSEAGVYGKPDGRRLWGSGRSGLRAWSSIEQGQRLLGIDWTDDPHQLKEAIPPAYTEYIGNQLTGLL